MIRWAGGDGRVAEPLVAPPGVRVHTEPVAAGQLVERLDLSSELDREPDVVVWVDLGTDVWSDAPAGRRVDLTADGLAPEMLTMPTVASGEWFVALGERAACRLSAGDVDGTKGQAERLERLLVALADVSSDIAVVAIAGAGHAARVAAQAVTQVADLVLLGTPLGPVSLSAITAQPTADAVRLLDRLVPDVSMPGTEDDDLATGRHLVSALMDLVDRTDPASELRPAADVPPPPRTGLNVIAVFGSVSTERVERAITAIVAAGLAERARARSNDGIALPEAAVAGVVLTVPESSVGSLRITGDARLGLVGVRADGQPVLPELRVRMTISDRLGWLVATPEHELRMISVDAVVPLSGSGVGAGTITFHDARVLGASWERLVVGAETDQLPLLPEARILLDIAVGRLVAGAPDAPLVGATVDLASACDLIDAAGAVHDAFDQFVRDPRGLLSNAMSTATGAIDDAIKDLLGPVGGHVDLVGGEITISAGDGTTGLFGWHSDVTIDLGALASGSGAIDGAVTFGPSTSSGPAGAVQVVVGFGPFTADLHWHRPDATVTEVALWPDPDGSELAVAAAAAAPALGAHVALEIMRRADEAARPIVDAALDALGVLGGSAGDLDRPLRPLSGLIDDPARWLRSAGSIAGQPAKAQGLFDALRPLLGLSGGPGDPLTFADGVSLAVAADGGTIAINASVDTSAFTSPAASARLAGGLTATLRIAANRCADGRGRPPRRPGRCRPGPPGGPCFAGRGRSRDAVPSSDQWRGRRAGAVRRLRFVGGARLGGVAVRARRARRSGGADRPGGRNGRGCARAANGYAGSFRRRGVAGVGSRPGRCARSSGPVSRGDGSRQPCRRCRPLRTLDGFRDGDADRIVGGRLLGDRGLESDGGQLDRRRRGHCGTGGRSRVVPRRRVGGRTGRTHGGHRSGGHRCRRRRAASVHRGRRRLCTSRREWCRDRIGTRRRTAVRCPVAIRSADARAGGRRRTAGRDRRGGRRGQAALRAVEAVLDLVASVALATDAVQDLLDTAVGGGQLRDVFVGVVLDTDTTSLIDGVFDPTTLLSRALTLIDNVAGLGLSVTFRQLVLSLQRPSPGDPIGVQIGLSDRFELVSGDVMLWLENDDSWIEGNPSGDGGVFVGLVDTADGLSFEPSLAIYGLGLRVGKLSGPLLDIGLTLESLALHVFAEIDAGGVQGGGAQIQFSELAVAASGASGGNSIASGIMSDTGSQPPQPAFSPALAIQKHGSDDVQVTLRAGEGDGPWWLGIQRGFGPLYLEQVGFGVSMPNRRVERVSILFDGSVSMFGLTCAVDDLEITYLVSRNDFFNPASWDVDLAGLAVSADMAGVTIAGGLLKSVGANGDIEYLGMLLARFGVYGITIYGGYGEGESNGERFVSFFAVGAIVGPIGGPPAFFLTGIGGGFGINRELIVPSDLSDFGDYPLIQALDTAAEPGNPMEQLRALGEYFPMASDTFWFAAGISFTSFVIVDGIAVVAVEIGDGLDINLLGLARLALPRPEVALVSIELALLVRFSTSEGVLWVQGQLTDNSWLLYPDVKLTGGFAFVVWFKGDKAGEFVLTMGGYHPDFHREGYPEVPRLGLEWKVSNNISISAGGYFALTSEALMAGGDFEASARFGPAWAEVRFGAHGIVYFDPFHYKVGVYARISAGVTVDLWIFGEVTISISIGASITVEGPDFHGVATFEVGPVELEVEFGSSARHVDPPLSPSAFIDKYLDRAPDGRAHSITVVTNYGTQPSGNGDPTPDGQPDRPFLVVPEFGLILTTVVPTTDLTLSSPGGVGTSSFPPTRQVGVAPMDEGAMEPEITLRWVRQGAAQNIPFIAIGRPYGSFPVGVWGPPQDDDNRAIPQGDVIGALTEVELTTAATFSPGGPEIPYRQVEIGPLCHCRSRDVRPPPRASVTQVVTSLRWRPSRPRPRRRSPPPSRSSPRPPARPRSLRYVASGRHLRRSARWEAVSTLYRRTPSRRSGRHLR